MPSGLTYGAENGTATEPEIGTMPSFPETTVKAAVTDAPITEEVVVTDGATDNSTEGNGQATFEISALLAFGASLLYNF
jgi:hypothetical protein